MRACVCRRRARCSHVRQSCLPAFVFTSFMWGETWPTPVSAPINPSIYPSALPYIHASACSSIHPFTHPSLYSPLRPSAHPCTILPFIHPSSTALGSYLGSMSTHNRWRALS
eukprot:354021-Chlamydomonas_euryale.AAC.2